MGGEATKSVHAAALLALHKWVVSFRWGNDNVAVTGDTGFSRSLGPLGIAFLTFSALSPAASVYIYGTGVIHIGGTGAIAGLIIGGLAVAIVGLLYGEIASAYPNAGGIFPAFADILGPSATFPYVALGVLIAPANLAFLSLGIASNIVAMAPGLPHFPVAACCICAATAIAVLNVRTGALITGLFLGIEVIALAIITTLAVLYPARAALPTLLHPLVFTNGGIAPMPLSSLGLAIAAACYACGGASWAANFAQEMVDPERRIGKVISWISPMAAISIAGPLILALLATPDLPAMLASDAPVATFLKQTASPAVATFINFSVLIALFNAAVAVSMGFGRFIYATGRDGYWPPSIGRSISRLHPTLHSPLNATVAVAAATIAMMPLGERTLLVLLSSTLIFEYVLLGSAIFVGRHHGLTGRHHRVPFHPVIPILAILLAGVLVAANWVDPDSGRPSLFVLVAFLALSFGYERLFLSKRRSASMISPPA